MKILKEKKFLENSNLIGSFEGTRAIVCTKRGEKGEQRRNNQRWRYHSFAQFTIIARSTLTLPAGIVSLKKGLTEKMKRVDLR